MSNCQWPSSLTRNELIEIYNSGKENSSSVSKVPIIGLTNSQLAFELCNAFDITPYKVAQKICLEDKENTLMDCIRTADLQMYENYTPKTSLEEYQEPEPPKSPQKRVKISKKETKVSLNKKVLIQEHMLYPKAILKVFNL